MVYHHVLDSPCSLGVYGIPYSLIQTHMFHRWVSRSHGKLPNNKSFTPRQSLSYHEVDTNSGSSDIMLVSSDLKTLETNCAVQSQHFRGLRPVPAGLSAASANLAFHVGKAKLQPECRWILQWRILPTAPCDGYRSVHAWHATSWFAWVYWCVYWCRLKKKACTNYAAWFQIQPTMSLCGHQTLLGIPHPAIAASRFKKACWGLQVLFIKRIATPPHRGRFKPQKHHRRNPIGEPSDVQNGPPASIHVKMRKDEEPISSCNVCESGRSIWHRIGAVVWYLLLGAASSEFWTQDYARLRQTRSFRLAILILTRRASHFRWRENVHRVHTAIYID